MKRCILKYFLLLVFISLQLLDSTFADSDVSKIGREVGKNVELFGNGPINLTLNDGKLQFQVCQTCTGLSSICYESSNGRVGSCLGSSSCEFKVRYNRAQSTDEEDSWIFGTRHVMKSDFPSRCLSSIMQYPSTQLSSVLRSEFASCDPKIDRKNGSMVQLRVNIDRHCHITVLNAKIHVPEIPTTPIPPTPIASATKKEETSAAAFPLWAIFICVFVGLLAFIAVGVLAFCIYKDRYSSSKQKQAPVQAPEDPKQMTAVSIPDEKTPACATVGEVSKAKPEPPKVVKPKDKIEDVPTAAVAQPSKQDPPQKDDAPPKIVGFRNPSPTRSVPRSLKSVKADSLQMITKEEKADLVETIMVSAEHHSATPINPVMVAEMMGNYPQIGHDVLKDEIKLFYSKVSTMFALVCSLSISAEQKLSSVGCVFDEYHRLIFVSDDGRTYLNDKNTAASTVSFAFGAEYHEYISDYPDFLQKASVPLLMVIALQPRFSEYSRRKACALLRRKTQLILCNFKAADREKMAFPINVIELAYAEEPKGFRNLSAIKTESSEEEKKKHGKAAAAGGKQRKKKSLKKRH